MSDEAWLRTASEVEELAALTAELVGYQSYPGNEGPVQGAVGSWFERFGIAAELHEVAPGRPNVLVRLENGPGPTLLLNGHVDTVLAAEGWSSDPWQARREGDRLYGLGACDMKAGVAAAMVATRALAQQRDRWHGTVLFTSVVDEEAYSIGAQALVRARLAADFCLVTEPGLEHPVLGAVGKVLVRGDVTGKAAHGSWPEQGINAAVEAAKLVARLDDMRLGQHPRLRSSQSLLSLHSGSAQYVITVPEKARFLINRHIVPGETGETVLAEMRVLADALNSSARFDFAIDPPYYPPWEIDQEHPMVRLFARAYAAELGHGPTFGYSRGVADSNYFAADLAIPTIYCGPNGEGLHQSDEWVDVPSIGTTVRLILRIALALLG
jgi:acetylornithine deacetylase/succinyl-diaminopimelate desuccinylase-like protein